MEDEVGGGRGRAVWRVGDAGSAAVPARSPLRLERALGRAAMQQTPKPSSQPTPQTGCALRGILPIALPAARYRHEPPKGTRRALNVLLRAIQPVRQDLRRDEASAACRVGRTLHAGVATDLAAAMQRLHPRHARRGPQQWQDKQATDTAALAPAHLPA